MLFISVISAIVAFLSFLFNFFTYRNRLRLEQAHNAVLLHEKWWSESYLESRKRLYKIVKEFKKGEEMNEICQAFLNYYSSSRESQKPDEVADFVKIVFFFSDLNVYIDENLITTRLAYRLLGESQYSWFQELIHEVRERIKISRSDISTKDNYYDQENRIVRWIPETEALEMKFSNYKFHIKRSRKIKHLMKRFFPS